MGANKELSKIISLKRYILQRSVQTIFLLIAVVIITFFIIHTAPGDPASILAGEFASPEQIASIRIKYGLDKPIYEQLFLYFQSILQGDFGFSIAFKRPVMSLIVQRLFPTFLLMTTAMGIACMLGIIFGVTAARKPYSILDNATTAGAVMAYAIPLFWFGQMMIIVFAVQLDLFPVQGMYGVYGDADLITRILDVLSHLVLPAVTLGLIITALITRITRTSMLNVLSEDYITLARAKGATSRTVLFKHALKNALLPVVTVIGLEFGSTFTGAIVVETVFGWPGLGRLMLNSIYARDYPTLMAMFIVSGIWITTVNFVTDIVYAYLDPRIRRK